MRDEAYIKDLLNLHYKDKGTFQQFEFSSWGMVHRPDFVILDENSFTYFEIKSELDSLTRLESQIKASRYLFTDMYLVAPLKHIEKAKELIPNFHYYCGVIALEDLELGNLEPKEKQMMTGHVSIESVRRILWSDELYNYVKDIEISVGTEKWTKAKKKQNKESLFDLLYKNSDSLRILNEVLPNRNWNYREARKRYKF